MAIQCPHCLQQVETLAALESGEVSCPLCGSHWQVVDATTRTYEPRRDRFGKYELLSVLGAGGFGRVYRARDTELDRLVALKLPRDEFIDGDDKGERFLREALNVARLKHPNIATLFDAGRCDGTPYLASELVEGVSLSDRLSAGGMTFRESAELVAALAEALDYAHQAGVVHRDLKPSNVMLDERGRPRLMDFGLAKRDAADVRLTVDGTVLGTPAYMSPEQAAGRAHEVDGRSDVYSLGVVFYELLTGQMPFRGNYRMLLHQVLHDEPRPPRALNDRVPRDLETVCLKAMAKEPHRRYARAGDLAAELHRWLRGEPVQARPVGRLERGWRWCRRNPVVAGLSAALVLLLVGGLIAAGSAAVGFYRLAASESAARDDADVARAMAVARGEDLRRQLSRQYVANGTRALDDGDHGRALLWFARALDLDRDDPERSEMHRRRLGTTWRDMPRLVGVYRHDAPLTWAEMSPDATRVVTASYDGTARLWDLATGRQLAKMEHPGYVYSARFSPDGRKVATACGDRSARVWDGTTGELIAGPWEHGHCVGAITFSPDGKRLAVGCMLITSFWSPPSGVDPTDPTKVRLGTNDKRPMTAVWDLERGSHVALECPSISVHRLSFSADGKRVASCGHWRTGQPQTAFVCDAETGKIVAGPLVHRMASWRDCIVTHVDLSPDATRLITATYDGRTHLWDVEKQTLLAAGLPTYRAFFSRDGARVFGSGIWSAADGSVLAAPLTKGRLSKRMAVATAPGWVDCLTLVSEDGGYRVYDVRTGVARTPLLAGDGRFRATLGAGGRYVVVPGEDHVARVWDLAGQVPQRSALGGAVIAFDHAPAAGRIVTVTREYGRVWDLAGGQSLGAFGHGLTMRTVALSPDGRRVATGTDDGLVYLWDAATGRPLGPPLVHDGQPQVHFDATGSRLTVLTGPELGQTPRAVYTWDAASRKLLWKTPAPRDWIALRLSPDGRRLGITRSGVAQVWDAATGQAVTPELKHSYWVRSPDFTADGKLLLTCDGEGTARVWDVAAGQLRHALPHPRQIEIARFSPDGKHLAAGGRVGAVYLWDFATARPVCAPLPVGEFILSLAFSPDGRFLAAGARGGQARLWDARTGEALGPTWPGESHPYTQTQSQPPGSVQQLRFTPDAPGLLVHGYSLPVRLLDLAADARPAADWLRLAEVQSGRRLSDTGSATALSAQELDDAWHHLHRHSPADVTAGADQARSWCVAEAARHVLDDNVEDLCVAAERALAAAPDDEQQWYYRGRSLLELKRYDQAIDALAPLAGRMYFAGLQLVEAYEKSRRVTEGIRVLGERLRTDPDNPLLRQCRAALYAADRQWQPALDDATAGLAAGDRANGGLHYLSGQANAELGRWPAARAAFQAALQYRPGNAHWHACFIDTLLALGDEAALKAEVGDEGIGARPSYTDDPGAANTAAWVCALTPHGSAGYAVRLMDRALAAAPGNHEYLNTRAYVLYRAARYPEALDAAHAAVKAHGKGGTIRNWLVLAMTYQQLRKPDDARREFDKVEKWFALPPAERRNDANEPLTWTERLELDVLHAEARRTLAAK